MSKRVRNECVKTEEKEVNENGKETAAASSSSMPKSSGFGDKEGGGGEEHVGSGFHRKTSVRVTRSDPLASTSERSHSIRNGNCYNQSHKLSQNNSFYSKERRARWIREKMNNYYRQRLRTHCNNDSEQAPRAKSQYYGYSQPYNYEDKIFRDNYPGGENNEEGGIGLRRQLTSRDSSGMNHLVRGKKGIWDNCGSGATCNSSWGNNWISENEKKAAKFHRPYSFREQRYWCSSNGAGPRASAILQSVDEEAGLSGFSGNERVRAGHSLPVSVDKGKGRFEFKEGNIQRYFGSSLGGEGEVTGDVTDQNNFEEGGEEDQEEDEEDDDGEEEKKISRLSNLGEVGYHFTRQTRAPYPYCLKSHHNLSGEGGLGRNREEDFLEGDREIVSGLRRSQSPCSISSESAESQGEKGLDPPRLGVPNEDLELGASGGGALNVGCRGRKLSVLFASYDAWNEESIIHSFKEMSPSSTAVFEAAWTGNLLFLEELFKEDGDEEHQENLRKLRSCEFRDSEGRTPLHLASICGHVPCIEFLLAKGAEVNCCDGNENMATPLSCAASCGSAQVVKALLNYGADVNSGYEQGKTALHWAIQAGSVDCAKILLEAGGKQNPPQVYSETPLHVAAALGDPICVQLLLDHGADVNLCKGSNRSTALHLSAEEGSAACVRLLLKAGASHEKKDIRGHTALHVAATCDADSVITLLKAGANPNTVDANGRTPLHCAVARGSRAAECVRLLVESGADIDAQDNYGYTPLHLSAVNESSQCASILLHHGSDVTLKTNAGTNALSLLVRRIPDVMRYLVERLDSAVTIHDHDPADPDCEIKLDFRAVVPNCEKKVYQNGKEGNKGNNYVKNSNSSSDGGGGGPDFSMGGIGHGGGGRRGKRKEYFHKPHKETEFLTCLVAAGNKKILAHPLSEAFLTLKWRRVRKFFWASLLFQIALVALFTVYVIEVYLIRCPYKKTLQKRNEGFIHREPLAWMPPPTPPDSYGESILENENETDEGNLSSRNGYREPKSNFDESGMDSELDSNHNISRRSANPLPDFSWVSFRPRKKKPVASEDSRYVVQPTKLPITTTPPTTITTRRTRGRGNVIPGIPGVPFGGRINGTRPLTPSASEDSPPDKVEEEEENMNEMRIEPIICRITPTLYVIWILLVAFVSLLAIKEVFQLLQSPLSYVVSSENWGQWLLIASVTLTAWSSPQYSLEYWQYPAAACGIFLAWGLMLLQVGRFPALGLYVQMLGKVAANFGLFILAYAPLLIAFALSFCVLVPKHFSSVTLSILKVFTMMVGEVDYEQLFEDEEDNPGGLMFPVTAHLLYGAFVVIVTIVLMNLLIGLAVSDIQGLQKGAKLNRLSRQTALISRLESFIFSKKLQKILPRSVGSILQKSALLVPSSYNWSYYFRPNDPRDKRLPKDIKQASLRLAASRHSSGKSKSHYRSHLHPNQSQHYHHSLVANGGGDVLLMPTGGGGRPMSTVSHIHRSRYQTGTPGANENGSRNQNHSDFVIRRIEQRLDGLQHQLDKLLGSLNGRMEAVLDVLVEQKPDLELILDRRQSEIENDVGFPGSNDDGGIYGRKSSSVSPSQSDLFRKASFHTSPSILEDASCEKG